MVCVNGSKGIGTGFSCDIPAYNPVQITKYIMSKLEDVQPNKHPIIEPYYEGFKGTISKLSKQKYLIKGRYSIVGTDVIQITELPVGTWTEDYKAFIESLMDDKDKKRKKKIWVKSYIDMSTDTEIDFTIKLLPGTINKLLPKKSDHGCNLLEKTFRLYTTKTETNMYLFDHEQKLSKYENVYGIIEAYFPVRLKMYHERKAYMIKQLERDVQILHNKARFIEEQCDDIIDLRRKKREQVIELLISRDYSVIDGDEDYKYLRSMRIEQMEEENMKKLRAERDLKIAELEKLKETDPKDMWRDELAILTTHYKKYKKNRMHRISGTSKKKISVKKKARVKKKN
jgi:DNA topoisomerase-2